MDKCHFLNICDFLGVGSATWIHFFINTGMIRPYCSSAPHTTPREMRQMGSYEAHAVILATREYSGLIDTRH